MPKSWQVEKRTLSCPTCGKAVERLPSELIRTKFNVAYCSNSCAAIANNTGRIKKQRLSCLNCGNELNCQHFVIAQVNAKKIFCIKSM